LRATPPTTDHPEFPSSNKQALSGRATESRLKSIQSGIAGFAFDPITAVWFPELTTAIVHLRDVLGDQTYEQLARKGEAMTTAAMATYAYDQIDQARAELNAGS
jgi:hypothetical protein